MDTSIRVTLADNGGVIVRYDDPEVVKKNREDDAPYENPEIELVYPDAKAAMPEAMKILKKLMGEESSDDDYESAFNEATSDE